MVVLTAEKVVLTAVAGTCGRSEHDQVGGGPRLGLRAPPARAEAEQLVCADLPTPDPEQPDRRHHRGDREDHHERPRREVLHRHLGQVVQRGDRA